MEPTDDITPFQIARNFVHRSLTHIERGDCTREEGLIAIICGLVEMHEKLFKQHMDLVNVQPSRPFVVTP